MEIFEDEEFRRKMLDELVGESRKGIHVTDLIYCLRKAYYRKKGIRGRVDDGSIVAMTVGRGAHSILEIGFFNEIPVEKDGIEGTIDLIKDTVVEIKTTRFGTEIKEHWIRQLMSYLYMLGKDEGRIVVVDVARNLVKVYRIRFERDELERNWKWMLTRKEILKLSLIKDSPPPGPEYPWECKNCEYREICGRKDEKIFNCNRG